MQGQNIAGLAADDGTLWLSVDLPGEAADERLQTPIGTFLLKARTHFRMTIKE